MTAPSSKRQLRVVEALNAKGFEFYGAYWCRYCDEQRRLLGKQASAAVAYVECDPGGLGAAPGLCKAAKIGAYPTWAAPDGRLFSGVRSLDDLEVLAGLRKAAPAKKPTTNKPPPVLQPSSPDALRGGRPGQERRVFYGTAGAASATSSGSFGKTAWPRVPAYECDPRGQGAAGQVRGRRRRAYPTWVVNGKTLTGVQTLAALEAALGERRRRAPPLDPSSPKTQTAADRARRGALRRLRRGREAERNMSSNVEWGFKFPT